MAEVLETLEVLIRARDAEFRQTLNRIERETQQTGAQVRRNLDFRDIGANLTGLAGGGGILYALREMGRESAATEAAWRVLRATVGSGTEFDRARGGISEVADTLKLTESQVVDSFTQMVRAGYGINEISELLIAGGASALAFGRDAVAGLEGVASAAVTGQSIALNAIGIAENIGPVMLEARKATAGLSEEQQKAAERAAVYNLITKATAGEVSTLGTTLDGLPGSQAAVNEQWVTFRNNVGGIAQEVLIPLNNSLAGTLEYVNALPDGTLRVGTAMVAAGAGATALAAGIGTLALVLGPLAGPAGLMVAVAVASAGIGAALTTEKDYISDVIDKYQEYRDELDLSSKAQRQAAVDRLETTKEEMRTRLELIRATIEQEKGFVESFINSSFGKLLLPGFIEIEPGASQDLVRQANELIGSIGQVTIDQNLIRGGATSLTSPTSTGTNTPTGTPTGSPPPLEEISRTIQDIFNELGEAGTNAQERANALGDTLDARLEAAETRANLLSGALDEVLARNDAPPGAVENLVSRLEDAQAEAEELNRLLGQGDTPGVGRGTVNPVTAYRKRDAAAAAAQQELDARRIRNAQLEAQRSQQLAENLETLRGRAEAAGEQLGGEVRQYLTGLVTAFGQLRDNVVSAGDRTDAILAQLERDAGAYTGTGPDSSSTFAGQDAEERRRRAFLANYLSNTSYTGIGSDSTGYDLGGASSELPELEVNPDPFADAGQQFLDGLVGVFNDAANQLGQAIGSGDFSQMGAGGIVGSIFNLGAGAVSGLGPYGALAGIGLSLIGGIFQGLDSAGQSDPRSEAAREIERRGGAATVNINAYITQQNTFEGGISDPQNDIALDRQIRRVVRAMFDELDIGRRLDRALPARG